MKLPRPWRAANLGPALCLMLVGLVSVSTAAHPGSGIAVDKHGNIYFLDTGSGLWKIDTERKLTHLSELRNHWFAIDADDRFASSQLPTGPLGEITRVGGSPTLLLSTDWPIGIGEDGNLYYPSGRPGSLQLVRRLPSGETAVLADLPATAAGQPLPYLGGLAAASDGSLYYTDDSSVHRITAQGSISTVVTVPAPADPPSIPATDQHPYLRGLAVDPTGIVYVADTGDARVLKITAGGEISTVVRTESPWAPTAVALSGNDVYVLEFLHTDSDERREWLPRVRRVAADGTSTIVVSIDQMPGAR